MAAAVINTRTTASANGRGPARPQKPDGPLKAMAKAFARTKQAQSWTITKATPMGSASGTAGGYLDAVGYSTALFQSIEEHSFIEPRALVIPMETRDLQCPKFDQETAPSAAGIAPFFGGVQCKWNEDNTTLTESEPKFRQATLTARTLIAYQVVSNQFVWDMGDAAELGLMRMFGRALAWYKEYAFLQGTGASNFQPLGILNAPCTKTVTRSSSGPLIADVATMAQTLLPFSWNHGIWACSPTTLGKIGILTGFIPNSSPRDQQDGCAGNLFARPLFVTEKLPANGTQGDLIFFDPSLYVIGNREDVTIEVSPHPNFQNNQTTFRCYLRCDGFPMIDNAITLQDTTTAVSAFVVLK